MSTWSTPATATLKVRDAMSTNVFTFPGVAASDTAGTPGNFLTAVNHLLDFAGKAAVESGMTRTFTQGVSE